MRRATGWLRHAPTLSAGLLGLAALINPLATAAEPWTTDQWLLRMHEASRQRAYAGTFVVSSGVGALSSARIWHACDGIEQLERIESLSGPPRSTYRRNDQVLTFIPEARLARLERRESLGAFPGLLKTGFAGISNWYGSQVLGVERIAGLEADVVQLQAKDPWRYSYRVWSEKKTGLALKLQTLDDKGRVLEQAAFSELQLNAPIKTTELAQQMGQTRGWRLERLESRKTRANDQGWSMRQTVPGFQAAECYLRSAEGAPKPALQWIFSDGLATVSLFLENFDPQRHRQVGWTAAGSTHTLMMRWPAGDESASWWLTAVGEVPLQTLKLFVQNLEHKP